MKDKSTVHIHRVVQKRLEEKGFKKSGEYPEMYDQVRRMYGKYIDEKGMIPLDVLQNHKS